MGVLAACRGPSISGGVNPYHDRPGCFASLRRSLLARWRCGQRSDSGHALHGCSFSRPLPQFNPKAARNGSAASGTHCHALQPVPIFWSGNRIASLVVRFRGLAVPDLLASAVLKKPIQHPAACGCLYGTSEVHASTCRRSRRKNQLIDAALERTWRFE